MPHKVVVIRGAVAGMRVARELIGNGFQVEVYDGNLHYVGGKSECLLRIPDFLKGIVKTNDDQGLAWQNLL